MPILFLIELIVQFEWFINEEVFMNGSHKSFLGVFVFFFKGGLVHYKSCLPLGTILNFKIDVIYLHRSLHCDKTHL